MAGRQSLGQVEDLTRPPPPHTRLWFVLSPAGLQEAPFLLSNVLQNPFLGGFLGRLLRDTSTSSAATLERLGLWGGRPPAATLFLGWTGSCAEKEGRGLMMGQPQGSLRVPTLPAPPRKTHGEENRSGVWGGGRVVGVRLRAPVGCAARKDPPTNRPC